MPPDHPIKHSTERRVVALALTSRIIVLSLILISDALFNDLSSSAHLQNFSCDNDTTTTFTTKTTTRTSTIIDSLAPWDSVYFVRIAKCGYETDMINAFFPLLPLLMRYGEKLTGMFLLEPYIPIESLYTLLGLIINTIAFCIAAVALYKLSLRVVRDDDIAIFSTILFCFNPASVFYSAVYTETLFAACSWLGLLLLSSSRHYWVGVVLLTAASAARSNGILACWFLLHPLLHDIALYRRIKVPLLLKTVLGCVCIVSPYIIMQATAYSDYCSSSSNNSNDSVPSWCLKTIPSVYGYVQEVYWEVGFLRFYEKFVRWPRVAQSIPVISLAIGACWTWSSSNWKRAFTLALFQNNNNNNNYYSNMHSTPPPQYNSNSNSKQMTTMYVHFIHDAVAPYVYHLALMTAAVVLVMHVNVATRFLSVSPLLYWYMSLYLSSETGRWRSVIVWMWVLSYIALGCLMFPNFYPWT